MRPSSTPVLPRTAGATAAFESCSDIGVAIESVRAETRELVLPSCAEDGAVRRRWPLEVSRGFDETWDCDCVCVVDIQSAGGTGR